MKFILLIFFAIIFCIEAQQGNRDCRASSCADCVNPNCVWCDGRCLNKNLRIGCEVRITESSQCSRGCDYNGNHYEEGATFKDDCNDCNCNSGIVVCTLMLCNAPGCEVIDCMDGTYCVIDENGNPECVAFTSGCEAVDCITGTNCVIDENGNPECVPITSGCEAVDCIAGTTCVLDENGVPECIPDPCMTVRCGNGQICVTLSDGTADCVNPTCDYNGVTYNHGDSFEADDGCNECSCFDGSVICTLIFCENPTCEYNGQTYQDGDSFPSTDGCNTCSCSSGNVACTLMACIPPSPCEKNCDCPDDQFCAKTSCNATAQGQCSRRPELCITLHDPVCGCDGQTYSNSCAASNAGVNVKRDGEC